MKNSIFIHGLLSGLISFLAEILGALVNNPESVPVIVQIIPYLIGGLSGSFLLLLSNHFLIIKFNFLQNLLLLVLGSSLTLSFFIPYIIFRDNILLNLVLLFTIWHIGMMMGLKYCIKDSLGNHGTSIENNLTPA